MAGRGARPKRPEGADPSPHEAEQELVREPRPTGPLETARRTEVLEAALELMSEHGIAGTSLRMLARKLGMQQPSLYHYFPSKEALVDQIVDYCAEAMVASVQVDRFPDLPLAQVPHFVVENTLALWQTERHVRFARFLFVVAIERPAHRPSIARVFEERLYGSTSRDLVRVLGGEAKAERVITALRMLASALGMALMEERVLFGRQAPSEATRRFAELMAESVAKLLTTEE